MEQRIVRGGPCLPNLHLMTAKRTTAAEVDQVLLPHERSERPLKRFFLLWAAFVREFSFADVRAIP